MLTRLENTINWLQYKGLFPEAASAKQKLTREITHSTPLPILILLFIGAINLTALLCFTLYKSSFFNFLFKDGESLLHLLWGVGFSIFGLATYWLAKRLSKRPVLQQFFDLSALSLLWVGRTLFITGMILWLKGSLGLLLGSVIIIVPIYLLFKSRLDRYYATLLIILATHNYLLGINSILAIGLYDNLLFLIYLYLCHQIVIKHKANIRWLPLGYACFTAVILATVTQSLFKSFYSLALYSKDFTQGLFGLYYITPDNSIVLNLIPLFIAAWAVCTLKLFEDNAGKLSTLQFMTAAIFILLFTLFTSSAISLSLLLFVLGHLTFNRIIIVLSYLLMPIFIICYYYTLDLDLFYKSIILFVSGISLLALRIWLVKRNSMETQHA